jgi:hypothetical protein
VAVVFSLLVILNIAGTRIFFGGTDAGQSRCADVAR